MRGRKLSLRKETATTNVVAEILFLIAYGTP